MAFFLPSFFQKRLLRYALSRLELLDTDALDLERLDIAWGKRSTVELRDVGLRLKQLSTILNLPPNLSLTKANILLLRVTLPADIYSSGIEVEFEGIQLQARIVPPDTVKVSERAQASTKGYGRTNIHQKTEGRSVVSFGLQDQHEGGFEAGLSAYDVEGQIPTAEDLAQSFLQAEPQEEKEELEAALSSQSQYLNGSDSLSGDVEEEQSFGTGTNLSLPTFLSDFLKGVTERLHVKIRSIQLDLISELSSEESTGIQSGMRHQPTTFRFEISEIYIDGVTKPTESSTPPKEAPDGQTGARSAPKSPGTRAVNLQNICGMVIADGAMFESAVRGSSPSNPTTTHTSIFSEYNTAQKHPEGSFRVHHSSVKGSRTESIVSGFSKRSHDASSPSTIPRSSHADPVGEGLMQSIATTEGGRFADAIDDDVGETDDAGIVLNGLSDSLLDDSAYLDQVTESSFSAGIEESDILPPSLAPFASRQLPTRTDAHFDSAESSKSMGKTVDERDAPYTHPSSSGNPHHDNIAPDILSESGHSNSLSDVSSKKREEINASFVEASDKIRSEPESTEEASGHASELPDGEDLSQSRMFSHEEAESMYMSALSEVSAHPSSFPMPGAWDLSSSGNESSRSHESGQATRLQMHENVDYSRQSDPTSIVDETQENPRVIAPLPESPRLSQTPSIQKLDPGIQPSKGTGMHQQSQSSLDGSQMIKNFLVIDEVSVHIPWDMSTTGQNFDDASRETPETSGKSTSISLGSMNVDLDFAVGRLLHRLIQVILPGVSGSGGTMNTTRKNKMAAQNLSLGVSVKAVNLAFLEILSGTVYDSRRMVFPTRSEQPPPNIVRRQPLISILMKDIEVQFEQAKSTKAQMSCRKFSLDHQSHTILSFDESLKMRASVRDVQNISGVDISLTVHISESSMDISFLTLPVHLTVDLQKLDDSLSCFGGFSGILEMGSSIASSATIHGVKIAPSEPAKHRRAVHFEGSSGADDSSVHNQQSNFKINGRLGGFMLELIGKECRIRCDTSAVKLVSRAEALGLQIDRLKLSGPYVHNPREPSTTDVILESLRLEYLPAPKEIDLSRLLSLLTPSKSKYDDDDDILLDTLLRQRSQGAVLRVNITSLDCKTASYRSMELFESLQKDLKRLSTVTKYLPDDDRPGILTLLNIRTGNIGLRLNEQLGELRFTLQSCDAAYVGLPLLMACSISKLQLFRNSDEELINDGLPLHGGQTGSGSPMVMARMIGDELEPAIKIKLFNIRVEYRVPFIMALMGMSENETVEEAVSDLVASVATLTDRTNAHGPGMPSSQSSHSGKETPKLSVKPLKIEVALADCIIGLNPRELSSRGLVVLTKARMSVVTSSQKQPRASLEISRGSLLIVDDTSALADSDDTTPESNTRLRLMQQDLLSELSKVGYVTVCYMSAAKAFIDVVENNEDTISIDVDVKNDLFVLETCADSTQTLLGILNGLKPPLPPRKELKYRTEIVSVQDMLASLSGEAFAYGQAPPDDIHHEDSSELGQLGIEESEHDLELLDSFYKPNSEDMFEEGSRTPSKDPQIPSVSSSGADKLPQGPLQGPETLDFNTVAEDLVLEDNHFGSGSMIEGTAHRWNSAQNTYGSSNEYRIRGSPLRIKIRDVHVIWNLYDGYDWQKTRDTITRAVKGVEVKATERRARMERQGNPDLDEEEESVIGDFLFNSIYIGIPANRDPRELSHQINRNVDDLASETESYAASNMSHSPSRQTQASRNRGRRLRLNRSRHHKMSFELKGVSADFLVFPPGSGETQSSLDVRVADFEIFDHIPSSTWKKFATYMQDAGERETGAAMVHLEILNVKPIPDLAASEIVLRATVLPLRLHVDQDALDFVTRFFEFKDDSAPLHTSPADVPFLQRVEVHSVRVKLDYKPKKVDYAGLRSGHTTEFMNFFVLDEADMILRHVIIYGVSGFDKLSKTLNDIWMPDIKRNQLPGVLAGLAPVRSLVNVGGGVRDLVVVPMREYRKDGRVVRSIQKGALAFAKTTTSELVKLGAKLAIGTQTVLQGAESFLNRPPSRIESGWEDDELEEEEKKAISLYADQPVGVLQGLRGAYASLERDLLTARDAIVAVPGEILESGTPQGAAKAVLKRAPTVIFRPAIGATKAISQTLMGATNALDPQHRRRIEEKYKRF